MVGLGETERLDRLSIPGDVLDHLTRGDPGEPVHEAVSEAGPVLITIVNDRFVGYLGHDEQPFAEAGPRPVSARPQTLMA